MPNLEYINTLNSSSVGSAIEVTVSNIASPTELNSRAAIQGDLVLARTTEAGTGTQTLYYADTTSASEDLPYIVSSATAGVKFIAVAGAYINTLSIQDSTLTITGSADHTKALKFEVDSQTANDTLTIDTGAQTDSRTATFPVLTGNSILALSNATLTSGRIPFATTNGILTDTANYTVTGSGSPILSVGSATNINPVVAVIGNAGFTRAFDFYTGSTLRWRFRCNNTAESGSNAGSDWNVVAYDDSGTQIDAPFQIARVAGGAVTFTRPITTTSTTDSTSKDTGSIVTEGGIGAEKAIRSGTRFGLAQAAGSTTDGDIWSDSTQKALQTYVDGIEQTLSGCIFTQTATRTIANTVTETSLFTTGVGTLTLPANFFLAGKTIRLVLTGTMADTGTPTVRLRLKYGSTTIVDSTALTLSAIAGTEEWRATCELTCRTTGVTGTVAGAIWFMYDTTVAGGTVNTFNVAPVVTTVDTTASGALDLSWQWGAADPANTVSCIIASAEVIN